jgi:1A family penicillin-binding protein
MNIMQVIIYYFVMSLIRIGDLVLFLSHLLFRAIKFILQMLVKTIKFLLKVVISTIRWLLHFLLTLLLFPLKIVPFRKKPFMKKLKHKKPITIFSIPTPGTKAKYFFYGTIFSTLFLFIPLAMFLLLQQLPNPKALADRQIPQTTKIYDRHGTLLSQIYGPQDRTLIPLSEVPDNLKKATIAIEDKNFYSHPGFDAFAIVRAARENASGRSFQGASTITQQLIRSSFLTNEPSFIRKIKEVLLAFWAERMYKKDEILAMYFNQIPYGGTAWGVEAASDIYFGKKAKDLDLAESAFLAGITSAPTTYSPYGQNPTLWKKRQEEVLLQMTRLGFITRQKSIDAKNEALIFNKQQIAIHAPHFVNYIKDFLVKKYGLPMVEKGGLNVTTSLDLQIQQDAETIVREEVTKARYLNLSNGALLVMRPRNGDILAMVGSQDFNDPNGGNVNLATSLRQPGSSIKVITYAAALTHGFTPATILDDSPITYTTPGAASYTPVNYDGKFHGKIPLRLALANSLNIPAVKTLNQVGIPAMVNLAKDMGVKSWSDPNQYGLSITLGAAETTMLDMTSIYATLANQGEYIAPNPILKITDYKGIVLEEKRDIPAKRVLPNTVAFIISDILADNQARSMEFGTNSPLQIPDHTVSVKTGTSDNKRDNWTIGYTNNFVTAVWVGNNDNSPMSQTLASGITGAAPIWNRMMTQLLTKEHEERFTQPQDIIQKPCIGRIEYFVQGTETNANCNFRIATPSPNITH